MKIPSIIKIFLLITLVFALWQDITFSAEITILNIHSHPQAGDNWIVSFETIGTADLTIIPDDKVSIDDLDFISLKCGEEQRAPQTLEGGVIFYPDWFCSNEGQSTYLVNNTKAHILKFQFGDKIEYAYNSPDISIYDFFSGAGTKNRAYEKSGSQPANPNNYDSEASAGDYTAISIIDDNNRWPTLEALSNEWDSHIYTFTINESPPTITSLNLEWEGYGEINIDFDTYFYIWNLSSGSWKLLASQDFTSESDGTLSGNITTNISNYIDAGILTLMTTTQKPGVLLCSGDGECASGFCRDGFCCNNDCSGDCEACNLSGTEGTCTPKSTNDDVITTCYYCNGVSGTSVPYSGNEGIGCTGDCTHCVNGSCDNWGNNEQREGCTGICEACQSGSCSFASAGTDPGDDCNQGSTPSDGCTSDYCSGINYSCAAQTSGDGGCPSCQTCNDGDIACDNLTSNWGSGLYSCSVGSTDDPNRCYQGACINCGGWGNAGYCWYNAGVVNIDCDNVCSTHGGTYNGSCNWTNDPQNCSTCRHWYPGSGCTYISEGPCWQPTPANLCGYHWKDFDRCWAEYSNIVRQCACNQ